MPNKSLNNIFNLNLAGLDLILILTIAKSAASAFFCQPARLGGQALRRLWEQSHNNFQFGYCITFDVLADEVTFFNIIYVIMATCALVLQSPYLYCFQLLDIVVTNETLRNVVRAVTRSTKQLSMTVVLGELPSLHRICFAQ